MRKRSGVDRKRSVATWARQNLASWKPTHLEKGVEGARYHAMAEEGVPFREIAQAIGRRVNLPVVSKSPEEASSERTRKLLGWQPRTHWRFRSASSRPTPCEL